jgi:hypothetical protein
MPPKKDVSSFTDDFAAALQNENIISLLGKIFDDKLKAVMDVMKTVQAENIDLKNKLQMASAHIETLEGSARQVASRVDALEAYGRRDNLIIAGVPLSSFSEALTTGSTNQPENSRDTEKAVLRLCNEQLQVLVGPSDISIAHRLPAKTKDHCPLIIVKFTSRKVREEVFRAKKQLKGINNKVYINEDLTKTASNLFRIARDMVRKHDIFSAWTNSGAVFVKKRDDPACKAAKMSTLEELQSLQ